MTAIADHVAEAIADRLLEALAEIEAGGISSALSSEASNGLWRG